MALSLRQAYDYWQNQPDCYSHKAPFLQALAPVKAHEPHSRNSNAGILLPTLGVFRQYQFTNGFEWRLFDSRIKLMTLEATAHSA